MARAMLNDAPMARSRLLLPAFIGALVLCVPATVHAQTISASQQPYPNRICGTSAGTCAGQPVGTNLGQSTRSQNLDYLGVSYDDCEANMVLQFSLVLTGFTGVDNVEVWASLNSDCTANTDRGIGATASVCWGLPRGFAGYENDIVDLESNGNMTYTFEVRVQDLIGWQNSPPIPSEALNPPAQGESACHQQPTPAAVSININFLAIDGDGNSDGNPYQYTVTTDLVGPPAPVGVGESTGDTLMNITWTANVDSDTAGYDVFMDPPPGQQAADSSVMLESGTMTVCPGSIASTDATAESDTDGSTVVEASVPEASITDAGCYTVTTGSSTQGTPGAACNVNDPILQGAIVEDAGDGAATITEPVYDEAGDLISEGGIEGAGGISTIPTQYLIGAGSGVTISDKSVGQYQVSGLTNGTSYHMVVAAVDGTGNVGPASVEVCDYPAPVHDFWDNYRLDGGQATGFCALETVGAGGTSLAGIGAVFVGAAIARRRRRGNGPRG